jgi:hypothetical protein
MKTYLKRGTLALVATLVMLSPILATLSRLKHWPSLSGPDQVVGAVTTRRLP